MPEWKSFTFGEDGEATPTAEAPTPTSTNPAMEPDEYAAKWGTEVSEVTIARIEAILEGDGLPHGSSEFIAFTQLEDIPFQVHREPPTPPGHRSRRASCPWARATPRPPCRQSRIVGTPSTCSPPSFPSSPRKAGSWSPRPVSSSERACRIARFTSCWRRG